MLVSTRILLFISIVTCAHVSAQALLLQRQVKGGGCVVPALPAHGNYTTSGRDVQAGQIVVNGSSLIYTCDFHYGFRLDQEYLVIICVDGKWSDTLPACARTCSGRISQTVDIICEIDGLPVNCSKPMVEGTVAKMQCKPNYVLSKESSTVSISVCKDGSWDYSIPKCIPRGKN